MAQRRMFSKKITETDMFLDMPISTQCLYFHLNMNGDDDGFIGNVKTVKRMIGASDDDLKLLLAKEFLIPFESGVVVIKDWKIHNYIRKDRYSETVYKQEKRLLSENESGQYEMGRPNVIPLPDQRLPQDKLGEGKLGEDKLSKGSGSKESPAPDAANAHSFYQNNFGVENSIISQNIDFWIDDLSEELVIEAMSRAALDQKGYRYAEGIMKSWDKKNIKTMQQVKAEDVAFENKKKGIIPSNQDNNKRPSSDYDDVGF